MLDVLYVTLGVTALALLAAGLRALSQLGTTISQPQPPTTPPAASGDSELLEMFHSVANGLATLDIRVDELTKAVAHGIDHVDRNEKRVRGIVAGAKRRFEASEYFDAAVDAEADSLPETHGVSVPEETVPDLQETVELGDTGWAHVPGMTP